jgi:hypothetical protein
MIVGITLSIILLSRAASFSEQMDSANRPDLEKVRLVHVAEHTVDHAWEVYHRAALGGTIASPAVQADIEQHLHEARTLLTFVQEAADRGDQQQVGLLLRQITRHTTQAIKGSKEHKK